MTRAEAASTPERAEGQPSPAVAQALRLLDAQRALAGELDEALRRAGAIRVSFDAGARKLEEFVRTIAKTSGFTPALFEYSGSERLRLWIRGRGIDTGFSALESRHLEALATNLTRIEEVDE